MPFKLQLGENVGFALFCGILALVAIVFFTVIYVADFKESRLKAKKKRHFERAMDQARRRRQRLR